MTFGVYLNCFSEGLKKIEGIKSKLYDVDIRIDKFNSIKLFYTPILIIKRILLKKYYLKML